MGENARPGVCAVYPAKGEVHQERHDHGYEKPFTGHADHVLESEKKDLQTGKARHAGVPHAYGVQCRSSTAQYADFRRYERKFYQRSAGDGERQISSRIKAFAEARIK